jgi:hypothetical protein
VRLTPRQGLITLVVGLLAFGLMPSSPTSSAGSIRGSKGWFSEREEKIMVNRIIREDPSKSSMHNREPLTPKLLWQSMKDYDLWPIYILGLTFQTPSKYFLPVFASFAILSIYRVWLSNKFYLSPQHSHNETSTDLS